MGKRKSTRKPQAKRKDKLDIVFTCPFCNHEKAVECSLDRKNEVGRVSCKKCDASFQTTINPLSEAVDVYHEWVDACEEVKGKAPGDFD